MVAAGQPVYVVTGASRGLGLEFVKQLLERGNHVVATARNPNGAKGLQALADKYPSSLSLFSLDVSNADSIKAAAGEIVAAFPGGIDVLINNAGIAGKIESATEQNEEDFRDILYTNVLGPYLVVKSLLPLIKKGNKKQILQISSTMGSIGTLMKGMAPRATPHLMAKNNLAYRASKSALNMETALLAMALKEEGIAVISICPGWVATDMGAGAAGVLGVDPPELQAPTSIAGMLKILDGVTLEQSGGYFNYRGETVPY